MPDAPWLPYFVFYAASAVWIGFFGASIGSFVNVVVWRLPRGINISHSGSRCPQCGHAIRPYDNIPVLSWLRLGGRCRDCRTPISSRYPIVESIYGLMFLLLAAVEWGTRLDNLPPATSVIGNWPPQTVWVILGIHAALLSTLLCGLLIERDGFVPPLRMYLPAILLCAAVPLVVPNTRPVAALAAVNEATWQRAAIDGLIAALVAGVVGGMVAISLRPAARSPWVAACVLCGVALGWQASLWLIATVAVIRFVGGFSDLLRWDRITALLMLTTLVLVLGWKHFWLVLPGWRESFSPVAVVGLLVVTGAATAATRVLLFDRWVCREPKKMSDASPNELQQKILASSSYKLAELDTDFIQREEMRPIRMQLELKKTETILNENQIESTIVAFGGTQVVARDQAEQRLAEARQKLETQPEDLQCQRAVVRAERMLAKAHFYDDAREFARIVSAACQVDGKCDHVIITGGGPGIMEAANRGAFDVGAKSIGLNITLPEEQAPNPFITPELCFEFHYFALRKMHFLLRAKALVVFPGGFGTLDELFDALTLRQTQRMQEIPILLYGSEYWKRVVDFQFLADEGVIRDEHLELITFVDNPQEAWDAICRFEEQH